MAMPALDKRVLVCETSLYIGNNFEQCPSRWHCSDYLKTRSVCFYCSPLHQPHTLGKSSSLGDGCFWRHQRRWSPSCSANSLCSQLIITQQHAVIEFRQHKSLYTGSPDPPFRGIGGCVLWDYVLSYLWDYARVANNWLITTILQNVSLLILLCSVSLTVHTNIRKKLAIKADILPRSLLAQSWYESTEFNQWVGLT